LRVTSRGLGDVYKRQGSNTILQLTYSRSIQTWIGGNGTWDVTGSAGSFSGTYTSALMGDTVAFNTSNTITINGYVNPAGVSIATSGNSDVVTFNANAFNGGGIYSDRMTVGTGKLILNTKNNAINNVDVYNQYATLETSYRNALYSAQSVTIGSGATFTPTDVTSVNGVVFALETGNLYLDYSVSGNQILTF
jgi:hypothetical protein